MEILLAWRKLNKIGTILCYGQAIIWNKTHIRANNHATLSTRFTSTQALTSALCQLLCYDMICVS